MPRFLEMKPPVPARNLAELLCDLGRVIQAHIRREAGTKAASVPLQSLTLDCQLAVQYVTLSGSVQLRAMVEDWPLHRIRDAVRAQL